MKKNKVGICACYNSRNYGSMLQAYASQIAIEKLGYQSEFIVYTKEKSLNYMIRQIPRLLNKDLLYDKLIVLVKKGHLLFKPQLRASLYKREQEFRRFQNVYYKHFSKEYYGYKELCSGASDYDTIVVGSDQLWTPGGLGSGFYTLMFVPDEVNKVSYATSFGVSRIPWYQINRTRRYLSRINHLSVRELRGSEIIMDIAGRHAEVVADPTLLLGKEEWSAHIPPKSLVHEKYIFCYLLGTNPEHRTIADCIKKLTGLPIVCTPYLDSYVRSDNAFGDYQIFDAGPDDFLNLIRGAEYVITDSFHGTIFSILHHKKFMTLNRFSDGTNSRNSRIDSLCSLLGLEERRYQGKPEVILRDIDYVRVDASIEQLRTDSLQFLRNALENNNDQDK